VIYAPCVTEVAVSGVFAHASALDPLGVLARFRQGFYDCLYAREDALFELADALLCSTGPVKSLAELCLAAEHRRGHPVRTALAMRPCQLCRACVNSPRR
jgi:hypothetical protein